MACLIGYGASAVCPWLTWETTRHWLDHPKTKKRIEQGKLPALDANQAQANVRESLENGLRKILSKICLLYTSPSPRDYAASRMPSSA